MRAELVKVFQILLCTSLDFSYTPANCAEQSEKPSLLPFAKMSFDRFMEDLDAQPDSWSALSCLPSVTGLAMSGMVVAPPFWSSDAGLSTLHRFFLTHTSPSSHGMEPSIKPGSVGLPVPHPPSTAPTPESESQHNTHSLGGNKCTHT